MAKKLTHKTRAIRKLEELGWTVADVEKQLRHTFITQDLFGFADLCCMKGGFGVLLVQVTSPSHVAARVKKMLDDEEGKVAEALRSGFFVEAYGMRDKPARDGSMVIARFFKLSKSGRVLAAFE
jgi:hypothetical protein